MTKNFQSKTAYVWQKSFNGQITHVVFKVRVKVFELYKSEKKKKKKKEHIFKLIACKHDHMTGTNHYSNNYE